MSKFLNLPKRPNSPAFKTLYTLFLERLEAAQWVLILDGALDRRTLDAILRKYVPDTPRTDSMERAELVGRLVGALLHSRDVAFSVFRSLDRSCNKERNIVISILDSDLVNHITQYKALDFRRERARMIWALLRDARDTSLELAQLILSDAFHSDNVHQQLNSAGSDDKRVHMAKEELLRVEAVLNEQQKTLQQEQLDRRGAEQERSELIVRLGQRERALKNVEAELRKVRENLQKLQTKNNRLEEKALELDEDKFRSVNAEKEALKKRVAALEKKIDFASTLLPLQDENAALSKKIEVLMQRLKESNAEKKLLQEKIAEKEQSAQERLSSLRGALKAARRLADSAPTKNKSEKRVVERVGLFVDVANVGASAKKIHGKNFDFIAMKKMLIDERKQVIALAFVVEAEGQKGMSAFSKRLMNAGFDVRIKRPRTRTDGSRKADWDMGIAMEVIEARNRVDTVILATGDGDFLPLIVKVKKWGKRVEVASFIESTDRSLLGVSDGYVDLTKQFLLERS